MYERREVTLMAERPNPDAASASVEARPEASDAGETAAPPSTKSSGRSVARGLLKTIRPHQWVKNLFVMAPMFFHKDVFLTTPAGPALNLAVTGRALLGTAVFSLLAGAVSTINDLVDVKADRIHPVKRHRPIASGAVPESLAKMMAVGLVLFSLAVGYLLDPRFALVALVYFAQNVAYSFKLQKVAFLDVAIIAFGFVLRVLAGGYATSTHVSEYLIACTALLALFLGFGKRRHELEGEHAGKQRAALEVYTKRGLNIALVVAGTATMATYIAYTLDPVTCEFFQTHWLWLTTPFAGFGIARFLMIVSGRAGRGHKSESPTQEMLRDVPFVLNLVLYAIVVVAIVYRLRPSA
ncbi:decaprenyl-phosphate phosphoribosyltransferase [soil metagenome]